MEFTEIAQITFLAIAQGLTEFLPVSSSGHLAVLEAAFDQYAAADAAARVDEKLTVSIVLHLGTLAAVLVLFWPRIVALLGADRRAIGLIVVACVPAVLVGVPLKYFAKGLLSSPTLSGVCFLVTAAMLLGTLRFPQGRLEYREMGYGQALLIGMLQAMAILPGISRSGATIVAGLAVGLRREDAAAFSFLLAIPTIGGAGMLELVDYLRHPDLSTSVVTLGWGGLVSFAVGLAAIVLLVRWVKQGRLHFFAFYLVPLGLAVLAWQWFFV